MKAKQRVDGSPIHIQGGNAGWCNDSNRLVGVLNQIVEQSRFTGAGAAGNKDVSLG